MTKTAKKPRIKMLEKSDIGIPPVRLIVECVSNENRERNNAQRPDYLAGTPC